MKKLIAITAIAGVATIVALFASASATVNAADETATPASWQQFVDRVAELVGVSSDDLGSAIKQAHEELGPVGGFGGGRFMKGMAMMEDVSICTDLKVEDIHDTIHSTEGMTLQTALEQLGVSDISAVKSCVVENSIERINELEQSGKLTADQAELQRTNVTEVVEDFFTKVREEGPMMHGGMRGAGMMKGEMEGYGMDL